MPRVICLVPSLTETLIECGVDVVGRTRFCIHPKQKVKEIAVVGGTKGVDWQKCQESKPDLVVFDREENLKTMADECPYPWFATHITSIDSVAGEFERLASQLNSELLAEHAEQWQQLQAMPAKQDFDWQNVPGQLKPLLNTSNYKRVEYIIWRDPWMAIGQQTFINSVLQKLGFGEYLTNHPKPYPELSEQQMREDETFYLFSSEPYRFLRYHQKLLDEQRHGAIVDGELFSWFGIRSYRMMMEILNKS